MRIVDAQVHLWSGGKPANLRHRQIPAFTKDELLNEMRAAGVDAAILHPPTSWDPNANALSIEAARAHPDRFAAFAALPTADPQASAKELERCVTKLGLKGAMIHGHTQGSFLDEKRYWPIFEAAQALGVPIYLHPTLAHPAALDSYFKGYEELARAPWGFAVDTSCHFLRLVFSGLFDDCPKLKIILGHLGEGIPFAMHRLDTHARAAAERRGLKKTPLDYFKDNLVVTTSGNWYEPAFVCTLLAMGIDNMLFAIDWPYESNKVGMEFFNKLSLSDGDKHKLAHGNAEKLLKL